MCIRDSNTTGHVRSHISSEHLAHSSQVAVRLVVLLGHSSTIDQQTSSVHLGLHISQLELGVLESRQRLAELLAVLQVRLSLIHI